MISQDLIRIAGVPEHFFYPWKHWFSGYNSRPSGYSWNWTDFPGGSGAMIQALENNETDYAFLLTESASKAISSGKAIKALSVYVKSPVVWGIHSGENNPIQAIEPVETKKYAISRFGSGSELMARVDAERRGGKIKEEQWVVVNHLDGAEKALTSGEADLFFWEKWTTKPFVDKGVFKLMGTCPAPWAGFVLVCRNEELLNQERTKEVIAVFNEVTSRAFHLKNDPQSASAIAEAYHQKEEDVKEWLQTVEWVREWTDPGSELEKANEWFRKNTGN